MRWNVLILVFLVGFFSIVSADVLSINSGGSDQLVINSGGTIEDFFFSFNSAPSIFNVILSATSPNNLTIDNLTVTYSTSDPDDDPLTNISDWRKNGNSIALLNTPFDTKKNSGTTRDYSTYENNCTINGATWISDGQVGGAYEFDSTDYLNCGSFMNHGKTTVTLWFRSSDKTQHNGLLDFAGSSGLGHFDFNHSGNGRPLLYLGGSNYRYFDSSASNYLDGSWHFLVLYINGSSNSDILDSSLKIDMNTIANSATLSSGAADAWNNFYIGRTGYGSFDGDIDEVKVYSYELTEEQLNEEYQSGLTGKHVEKIVFSETEKGETWVVAMTANDRLRDSETVLSNSLTIENEAPYNPDPVLVSVDSSNESDADLNCSTLISDLDSSVLDVSVRWYKDTILQFTLNYNNEDNGTIFSSILDEGNLTLGDTWYCSVQVSDESDNSNWVNSNTLTIIDSTNPIVNIVSPEETNYSTLNVSFNVTIVENEEVSMCFYNLDGFGNVSMTELNNFYFYSFPTLGPGPHDVWFYCNDTSGNWGANYTNFAIDDEAAIAILLPPLLSMSVKWDIRNLPVDDLDAEGNNGTNATDYWINVSATNTLVDLYVRADGDLFTSGLDVIPLENENFTFSNTDPNVTGVTPVTMNTTYIKIGDSLGDNSMVYLKFYIDASAGQPAGVYLNQLDVKAVRNGQSP